MAYEHFKGLPRSATADKTPKRSSFNGLNFEKRKVHSSFIDNIQGADLADIELLSIFNKGIRFLLCVIDIYSKYPWVIPLRDAKGT